MSELAQILPQFPYDILNIILTFAENGMITHSYRNGHLIHFIQWKSEPIYELEATILIRRLWPLYWCYHADPDDKFIYFYMKSYFKQVIQEEGVWRLSDRQI
jgi:hypothetical protein